MQPGDDSRNKQKPMNNIRNIIFDLGAVIINIDMLGVNKKLTEMGVENIEEIHAHMFSRDVYHKLETGRISPEEFRNEIRKKAMGELSDEQLDEAWNNIILDIPPQRIKALEEARKLYRTFLLSNTNIIHYEFYNACFREQYGYDSLSGLFEKAYFSHVLNMRKPDPDIYRFVLEDAKLDPAETLFIDDKEENVRSAESTGMQGYHLVDGTDMTELFEDGSLRI